MSSELHVYHRQVLSGERDSLFVIAEMISAHSEILDLGMGSGALGKHLGFQSKCTIDGVTINADEAALAKSYYRQVEVADLDLVQLGQLFDSRYDYIVCADVLEHLRNPELVLTSIRELLKPTGKLITSIPNAGYCGLCAELIMGDFRYRPEGLLDHTHLRFFTRLSMERFFEQNGWHCILSTNIIRTLDASEFRIPFDSLPPAVANHLLAIPDALTYQFISVLEPSSAIAPERITPGAARQPDHPAFSYFSAALYLANGFGYNESNKIVQRGVIGRSSQHLQFFIPPDASGYKTVRLDPADREGFFRIYSLQLTANSGRRLWAWFFSDDSKESPFLSTHQFISFRPGSTSVGMLALLLGNDPWIELALDEDTLKELSTCGGVFEAEIGWPMSADYYEAASAFNSLEAEQQRKLANAYSLQADLEGESARLRAEISSLRLKVSNDVNRLQSQISELQQSLDASQAFAQTLLGELRTRSNTQDVSVYPPIGRNANVPAVQALISGARSEFDLTTKQGTYSTPNRPQPMATNNSFQPTTNSPRGNCPVDIVVPVYRGLSDTQICIQSVLRSENVTPWRLIVINDKSPEDEIINWLRQIAGSDSRILLLENSFNLGFVGTVNRGMQLGDSSDIVLLNSDTEVANNWLDRLQSAAYSQPNVASVTPFSNNATICSYPRFCVGNSLPSGFNTQALDRIFSKTLAGATLEIPTAIGFCMYIRRDCLNKVGLFDVANFGKGYGEENDFCMRAMYQGWVNLHALDVFVLHTGGISFGASKTDRELAAMETMRRLHPGYEKLVHQFVTQDPAAPARLDVDIARIVDSQRPVVLNVSHNREGGTLRHVRELSRELGDKITFLSLIPAQGGVLLSFEDPSEAFSLRFALPDDYGNLRNILQLLRVGHIHFHHLLGHRPEICQLPTELGVTYDFTAHDYYSFCPQITLTNHTDRYCGELGVDQCRECVAKSPAPQGESIDSWRARHGELLQRARYVIAPSEDVAARIRRFVPSARVRTAPHASIESGKFAYPAPRVNSLGAGARLKVAVIGALSKIKGGDVLEEVALAAARQGVPVDFHLIGYAYRNLAHQPRARLTVHGSYEEGELPDLLSWLQPDLVWFPAQCPETYSYTLSAALENGYPVVAPDLGAFSERLDGRAWTWICRWNSSPSEWIQFFSKIRETNFVEGNAPSLHQHKRDGFQFKPLDYATDYLTELAIPHPVTLTERKDLRRLITLSAQNAHYLSGRQSRMKAFALRWLITLRAQPVFSSIAKYFSASLQRRVKSWLVR